MTAYDNFVSRWARLKRNFDIQRGTGVVANTPRLSAEEVSVASAETTVAQPRIDAAADEPFDPASLPSIESIGIDTDIRGFLQSRVPAELTRAALRQAWASDPAIRDFIGIAENQWDFNDPNAIPGFGPLPETDNVPALLAQALGKHDKLAEMIPEIPAAAERSLPAATNHEPVDLDRTMQQTFEGSASANNGICSLPDNRSAEDAAAKSDHIAEEDGCPRNHRSHGSALPR